MNMDEIKFQCPNCMGSITAGPQWFGKSTGCPHCNRLIQIPLPASTPTPASAQPIHVPAALRSSRPVGRFAAFVKQRKPFVITVCSLFTIFLGLQIHLRAKPEPKPDRVSPAIISDDPFVLSNGYRVQNLQIEKRGSDGRIHILRNSEDYQAFKMMEEEAGPPEDNFAECSACNGTGKNRSTSVSRCSSCSGQGTRITPSGHRMICGGCDGTGIEKQDPECIYCHGSGRVK
jgi:hypothetical protein